MLIFNIFLNNVIFSITFFLTKYFHPRYIPSQHSLVIDARKNYSYVAVHKPRGYVTNAPQAGEVQASSLIPPSMAGSLSCIGRLDKDSEGLLLFTSDPTFTYDIINPYVPHTKEYHVWVSSPYLTHEHLQRMAEGEMIIMGSKIKKCVVEPLDVDPDSGRFISFRIVLTEGKNRQIRRMVDNVGSSVTRLVRVRIGHVTLLDLEEGKCRRLTPEEVAGFRHDWSKIDKAQNNDHRKVAEEREGSTSKTNIITADVPTEAITSSTSSSTIATTTTTTTTTTRKRPLKDEDEDEEDNEEEG
eukprot:TRINITY_DN10578_c0_g1_i5.p1 TRINITY_DN10578_c0_g1~~TRINITY_DN10578_c0_g1_i5.p1  ORF type:complete len:299 (-),score=44.45 TRINITY_DN10578_c0_g1_i5:156-1052(-)